MPGPPRRLLPLLLLVCLLVPSSGGNGLKALVRYHAMPLIQTLLEQGPQEPGTALRSDLNTQHLHFMMDLYRRSADSDGRPRNGRQVGAAVRLVRPITQASVPTDGHWHIQKLTFGLQGVITAEELVRASVMHPRATHITNACISTKVRVLTKSGPSLRSKISNGNHMFVETDLTSYLKPLIQEPEKTFKLELHIICRKIRMRPAYLMDVNQSDVPFLLLYLNHTIHPVSREGRIHEDHKGDFRRMDNRHKQLLRHLRLSLSSEGLADGLVPQYLLQEDIITVNQLEEIRAQNTSQRRAMKLLDILPTRGPRAFDVFLSSLALEFPWVKEKIEEYCKKNVIEPMETNHALPTGLCHSCPSDKQLNWLAGKLGPEWEQILISLGLEQSQLYRCKSNHPYNIDRQVFEGLIKWKQQMGSKATMQCLWEALKEAEVDPSLMQQLIQ
uniref:Death domain-containing protein n=1 Tax=Leptobrachium leishanense TaxID=445787 RepID=A0A8C5WJB3_9ANUR